MNELNILDMIEKATGKDKELILKDNNQNCNLGELLDAALNFKRKFYIKKFNVPKATSNNFNSHEDFMNLLSLLQDRKITGNLAVTKLETFLSECNEQQIKWYSRIVRKDLKSGINVATVNKAGYDIPKFDVQLAKDGKQCKNLDTILKNGAFHSPKLDGYRCVAIYENGKTTLYSRNGTTYENFPSIQKSMNTIISELGLTDDNFVFDGEIMSSDFNAMQQSAFASKRGTVVGDVVYYIFDMIPYDEWCTGNFKAASSVRYKILDDFFMAANKTLKPHDLKKIEHKKITSKAEIEKLEFLYIEQGYEGLMLNPDIPYYRGKKSNKMLKFKTFESMDCKVLSCYEGEKGSKNEGKLGGITVLQENGVQCDVGNKFSDNERELIWKSPSSVIGRIVEVKYQNLTNDKKMRFPIVTRWRDRNDNMGKI